MNPLFRFLVGVRVLFSAMRIISSSPSLLLWSVLPLSLTLGFYLWLYSPLHTVLSSLLQSLTLWILPSSWITQPADGTLFAPIHWVSTLLVLGVSTLTFSGFAGVLSVPFNDFLAESAERQVAPKLSPTPTPTLPQRTQILWTDLKLSLIGLALTFAALFLGFIPLVNFLAPLPAILGVALQYLSYPQSRRQYKTTQSLRFILRHPWETLGFGLIARLVLSIPLLACFFIPILVVAGTALYSRLSAEEMTRENQSS